MSDTTSQARRWVLHSPELVAAQRLHSRISVGVPLLLLLAGPLYLPAQIDAGLAFFCFALMCALAGCLGISVGYHRHFAHRAFRAAPWLRAVMAITGQMAGQGPVLYWTALHRRHHSFSDRPGDPHSPSPRAWERPIGRWQAFWHGHFRWASDHAVPLPSRYVPDLLADPLVRRINEHYHACLLAGIALPTAIGALWTGGWDGALTGFYFGAVLRLVVSTQAIWSLNSVCHSFGSRPHDTGDFSTNNAWLTPLVFGENWHNNHHHAPTHARFGHGWRQPDPGWWTIAVLRRLGAVWDVLGEDLSAAGRAAPPR
jgi:stearoyl-CoA desaturase (Delta-9 desaturase)